jgi:hypothetical protein
MLLEQGASAAQIDAKIGRSAISFVYNEPVNDLVAADAAFQPTKVIVMLGTNDLGRDLGNTQQAMTQIRDAYAGMGAEVWAIGPMTYVGRSESMNALAPDVFSVMQNVFGADKTIDARPLSVLEGRTGDGVHFTYAAALPTAQALAQALTSTSSTSSKIKKGLIIAGIGVVGIVVVGYALSALKKRQLLGPIGMLISPKFAGPALMAYDARRNLESRPSTEGYRVAYMLVTRRNGKIVPVRAIVDAPRPLTIAEAEAWRRKWGRSETTWIETMTGKHVPVKGAVRPGRFIDDARRDDVHALLTKPTS